jgi:hypothetical protein
MHYSKISMFTLQIWVFKSSVFRKKCILCEHSTEENIGGANMANNRHATNRNFIQSYWMSDGLLLYNSQSACETTHPNQHRGSCQDPEDRMQRRSVKTSTASLGHTNTDAIRNRPCSEKTMVNN